VAESLLDSGRNTTPCPSCVAKYNISLGVMSIDEHHSFVRLSRLNAVDVVTW
jgi:hypothetical protein